MIDNMVLVIIIKDEQTFEFQVMRGTPLIEILREAGIFVTSPCGGNGRCGKCKVLLSKNNLPEPDSHQLELLTNEEINSGFRLACRVIVNDNLTVKIESNQYLEIQNSELESEYSKPGNDEISFELKDSQIFSELGFRSDAALGIAIDIGTTTVAMYLVQMENGRVLKTSSSINPQIIHGADVITRIHYAGINRERLEEMRELIISCLNSMIDKLEVEKNLISKVIISGNTVMLHLLQGMDVASMGSYPYNPVNTEVKFSNPLEIGIKINSNVEIVILPSVSAFIGADVLSGLIATDIYKSIDTNLLIDLGTNGEMVLGNKDRLIACSTAIGPAFEGANIECGIACIKGAIDKFEINRTGIFYSTIFDGRPIGICGTGIIDIIAELLEAQVVDSSGRMLVKDTIEELSLPDYLANRVIEYKGQPAFLLNNCEGENTIVFTQRDVRQIQLAKAAIVAGIGSLIQAMGIGFDDIKKVYLAGGFGSCINIENAIKINLIPEKLRYKIFPMGNTSALGAIRCLVNQQIVTEYIKTSSKVEYIDLSGKKDFQDIYISSMNF